MNYEDTPTKLSVILRIDTLLHIRHFNGKQ